MITDALKPHHSSSTIDFFAKIVNGFWQKKKKKMAIGKIISTHLFLFRFLLEVFVHNHYNEIFSYLKDIFNERKKPQYKLIPSRQLPAQS